jgi:hypothetical protein
MHTKGTFQLPPLVPGNWRGEIVGGVSVNLGQVVQPGPPRQSVEFSYIILPASLLMPTPQFRWPGVVMIMVPTPLKTNFTDTGELIPGKGLPSLHLSLQVTREQFSDMLRQLEARRIKDFHFTVEAGPAGDMWPVHSWGMGLALS